MFEVEIDANSTRWSAYYRIILYMFQQVIGYLFCRYLVICGKDELILLYLHQGYSWY